jgi:NAD(P)-dependent dehydrogenase (short-subunit alcohol dehydrogenase family)
MAALSVVTGANRGLGLEMCVALARAGHRVLMAVRDIDAGLAAKASRPELQAAGVRGHRGKAL